MTDYLFAPFSRDLEHLWPAINYHAKDGFHRGSDRVVPPEGSKIQTDKRHLRHVARFVLIGWSDRHRVAL
jgi:hypothetical protein